MDNSGRFGGKLLDLTQMLAEAVRLHRTGALTQAERVYRRILNTRSDHFEARHLLGLLRLHQGRVCEAFELVAAALAARPDYVPALSTQALLFVQSGRLEEALASLDRALLIEPDSAELLNDRGNTLNELGRREQALASYERALAARPDYPKALNNRGLVLNARPLRGGARPTGLRWRSGLTTPTSTTTAASRLGAQAQSGSASEF
jgi:tetratricopeptide (TPR) repeat protein